MSVGLGCSQGATRVLCRSSHCRRSRCTWSGWMIYCQPHWVPGLEVRPSSVCFGGFGRAFKLSKVGHRLEQTHHRRCVWCMYAVCVSVTKDVCTCARGGGGGERRVPLRGRHHERVGTSKVDPSLLPFLFWCRAPSDPDGHGCDKWDTSAVDTWHQCRAAMLERVKGLLVEAAGARAATGTLVLVEDNFSLRSMRKPYVSLARARAYGAHELILHQIEWGLASQ